MSSVSRQAVDSLARF